jgi:hypothetical protein
MPNTKTFPLRVVLTVTTGRLLTKSKGPRNNRIEDLYEILSHMTGDKAFPHTSPRFGDDKDECKPWLLRWFPELEKADAVFNQIDWNTVPKNAIENTILEGLKLCVSRGIKPEYEIGQIPADDHKGNGPPCRRNDGTPDTAK